MPLTLTHDSLTVIVELLADICTMVLGFLFMIINLCFNVFQSSESFYSIPCFIRLERLVHPFYLLILCLKNFSGVSLDGCIVIIQFVDHFASTFSYELFVVLHRLRFKLFRMLLDFVFLFLDFYLLLFQFLSSHLLFSSPSLLKFIETLFIFL